MKQGRTPEEMLDELKRQSREKRDFIVPSQSMTMSADGREIIVKGKGNGKGNGKRNVEGNGKGNVKGNGKGTDTGVDTNAQHYGMTGLFHRQIGSTLKIPAAYYDLMRKEKPELLAENVNAWLGSRDNSFMLRTMDYGNCSGRVARALLSERYRRIDNLEIAAALLPPVMNQKGFEIVSSQITEGHLFIKITQHLKTYEVRPGDYMECGIVISNSEVGLGAVSVMPFLTRLVCMNGMTVNDLGQRKHHVGRAARSQDDSYELYSDSTLEADDKVLLMKLKDVEMAALDESRYPLIIDKLRDATEVPITGKVAEVVELAGKSYGFSQAEQEGILDALIRGGDMTLYGLSNAVTRASQDVESYDRATEMEGIGWQIATMPPAQWKEINS